MQKRSTTLVVLFIAAVVAAIGIRALSHREPDATALPATAAPARATFADQLLRRAELLASRLPGRADAYNLTAAALLQKARETGDFTFNAKAGEAVERALTIEPHNPDALNLKAALMVVYHRFAEALDAARSAARLRPDNPDVYGVLTDALVEMGRYDEAREAAQRMMDLRPDTASYARVAHLRALYGDTEGAIQAMRVALRAANPRDLERVAWCRVQLSNALLNEDRPAEAEVEIDAALASFPDYHLALAAKGRARMLAGDFSAALDFLTRAQQRVPQADVALTLGDLRARLGDAAQARRQYELFEFIEKSGATAASRSLAMYWAERGTNLDEALAVARRERESRADIYAADTLAWVLFRRGDVSEARSAIDEARRLGSRDARILFHAGMIYRALGDGARAAAFLRRALAARTSFDNSNAWFGILRMDEARQALAELRLRRRAEAKS